jgi:hypothetical protein
MLRVMGHRRKVVQREFIQYFKSIIESMQLIHLMVRNERKILKTNSPS